MKLNNILTEMTRNERGTNKSFKIHHEGKGDFDPNNPQDYWYSYHFDYNVNGGDFSQEIIQAHKKDDYNNSFKKLYAKMSAEYDIKSTNQKIIQGDNPIWTGYNLGKVESHTDEDIDGPFDYVTGMGVAAIVSTKQLTDSEVASLAKKLETSLDKEAAEEIEDVYSLQRDADSRSKDPYAHYGLSRSDFR